MQHLALYRKYRSNSWDEIIGQDHVVNVLEGAIKLGNISHAYLFFGGRGTGKTSVARILAKELKSSVNDTYEIDAASSRGIDEMRELRDSVRTLPFDSKYKVYIIDEVHMLTTPAFNALLKTLEEPPAHVIFVLATTEMHKVPETIISRCQTFTFKKPSESILKKMVSDVAEKEGVTLDSSASELVAVLGDGSFRDTLGVLEKVISYSDNKNINREDIEKVSGAPSTQLIHDLLMALVEKDISKSLAFVGKAYEQNGDMKIFTKLLLYKLRLAMLFLHTKDLKNDIAKSVSESDLKFLENITKEKNSIITSKSLDIFLSAYEQTSSAFIQTLPLELAIIKIVVEK